MNADEEVIYKSFIEFVERNEDLKKSYDGFLDKFKEAVIQFKRELEKEKEGK